MFDTPDHLAGGNGEKANKGAVIYRPGTFSWPNLLIQSLTEKNSAPPLRSPRLCGGLAFFMEFTAEPQSTQRLRREKAFSRCRGITSRLQGKQRETGGILNSLPEEKP